MPRGKKTKTTKKTPKIKPPLDKINDIDPNDPYTYDPSDAYGDKLRR